MFTWKNKPIETTKELMSAIEKITSKDEAQKFMQLALEDSPHAKCNIGYLTGYCSAEERHRISDLFEVEHPIFGLSDPLSTEQLLQAGMAVGRAIKDGKTHEEAMKIGRETYLNFIPMPKFEEMLNSVGGIEGIKECLAAGNDAPLQLVLSAAKREIFQGKRSVP